MVGDREIMHCFPTISCQPRPAEDLPCTFLISRPGVMQISLKYFFCIYPNIKCYSVTSVGQNDSLSVVAMQISLPVFVYCKSGYYADGWTKMKKRNSNYQEKQNLGPRVPKKKLLRSFSSILGMQTDIHPTRTRPKRL